MESGMDFEWATTTVRHSHAVVPNPTSAREHPEVIREYLTKECSEGRVLGPLDPDQFPYVHTSRFGVIPKGSAGKWRLIVDLSAPEGASVNNEIDKSLGSLSYVSIADAAEGIRNLGRGALLAKVDVSEYTGAQRR
jgi:hypothetical protein